MEYGIWNMEYGMWNTKYGIQDMEYGIRNPGCGKRSMEYGNDKKEIEESHKLPSIPGNKKYIFESSNSTSLQVSLVDHQLLSLLMLTYLV